MSPNQFAEWFSKYGYSEINSDQNFKAVIEAKAIFEKDGWGFDKSLFVNCCLKNSSDYWKI